MAEINYYTNSSLLIRTSAFDHSVDNDIYNFKNSTLKRGSTASNMIRV